MEKQFASEGLVIFVDIAGSTQLYEKLGDLAAYTQIATTLAQLGDIVHRYGGQVIKHIGDEVLCFFEDVVAGIRAMVVAQIETSTAHNTQLAIRVGCHYGPILSRNNDIYGDTVNIAAHLASLARAQQILTSEKTLNEYEVSKDKHIGHYQIHGALDFSQPLQHRFLTQFSPKGKQESINAVLLYWESYLEDAVADWTFVHPIPDLDIQAKEIFCLESKEQHFKMASGKTKALVGRVQEMDVRVFSRNVSRQHGMFELKDGQILYTDQSSNGTYIQMGSNKMQFIHRQTVVLTGEGRISFGVAVDDSPEFEFKYFFKENT
ncbi:MAG: adenylate/guanylate cyclase domain-containing protein [Pseudomonadota bacterium]|nr:hypothetical protein [Gammaproteobacteria bacterium]MEC8010389.1 adenylate/guanylate cyclase domain-containing protein [Pseudomonadota bacterium]HBF08926.1 hypothetical protein [Gammaproteobacteria bacterium]|tara:strand:- start:872 stop:1831 length:960 start_codon:yes stop_codon:yes gene_type:complete